MNMKLNRLLSALLALCMVVGTFTALFTSSVLHVSADETDGEAAEVQKGDKISAPFDIEDLATTMYATPEDKLKTMSKVTPLLGADGKQLLDRFGQVIYEYEPWNKVGDYELYVQEKRPTASASVTAWVWWTT